MSLNYENELKILKLRRDSRANIANSNVQNFD